MKVVVIGTNHAGTTAVRALKKVNPAIEVVTYDKNDNISFLGCGIALWVKGEFQKPDGLFYASPAILAAEGIKVHMRHEILAIDKVAQTIEVKNLDSGEIFTDHYDKLIAAVGSWPIIPPIENIDYEGIKIVKWYQHAQAIKAANNDPAIKKVVVCGAGYIGVELVDAFHEAGKAVTLIDICPRIMPNYYDKVFTDKVETAMKQKGVHLAVGETVKRFEGNDHHVSHVVTDQNTYPADLVIWAVGFRPATKLFAKVVDLAPNGAIKVNSFMQTSEPNIYAIGDCIEVYDNAKQTPAYIALATTSVRTGFVAALNIAGKEIACPGFQGSNAINVFGVYLSSTGVSEATCQRFNIDYESITVDDADRPEFMHDHLPVTLTVVWDKKSRHIIGAQVGSSRNHTEVIYFFSLAIQKKLTIDELPFVDIFFLPHINKPFNFITTAGLRALNLDLFEQD